MNKRIKWIGIIMAVILAVSTINIPVFALDYQSTYYYEYYEPTDDVPNLKTTSFSYKTIQKFLYDIAKHVPYVSGTTDCSGEATRALCYGLGGANYYGKISLADTSTKAALYLNGTTVTWVGSYYNVLKNVADGTKVTLKSYDGTSSIYTKYCVKGIPTALNNQGDIDTLKKAFSYAKHAGAICFYYNGSGGHMWISLGQFPESMSAANIAAYLNNTYLAGTGAVIDPNAKTQSTSDRLEIYMHLGQWHNSWNIFRATSDSPVFGMGINNVYTGSGYGDMYILVPDNVENQATTLTPVKVEVKDSVTGSPVTNAKIRVYEYDAYNNTYYEYNSEKYVDLVYSDGYYVLPAEYQLNGVTYKNRMLKATTLNGGKYKIVRQDSDGYNGSFSKEIVISSNDQQNLILTGNNAIMLNPLYGLNLKYTDPKGNGLSNGKFTFTFDNVTYYGKSAYDGSVSWYASISDLNNGYPSLGNQLSLPISKNTVGILKQTEGNSGYRINKQYLEGVEIDLSKGNVTELFAKYTEVLVDCLDNNSVTIRRQDSYDGKLTTAGVEYLFELQGEIYFGRTDEEGYIVWYTGADRSIALEDTEDNGRKLYITGISSATGILTELGTSGYENDNVYSVAVGGTSFIIINGEGVAAEIASGSISRPLY